MAVSSPTSSYSSSFSSPFTASRFSNLPVMALRDKIVEKIIDNRVTLIVGETGCGKSSQVPQFLLEENMEPILCTQPRRFAVVAVAKMVAKARNCELGGEVGYHIGHSKNLSARSKIVFKTAGVLLDEMRDRGLSALQYRVIILDEVHERSVESDLVLVCVKQLLQKNNDLRLVLMSATADISRYRDYFRDLGRGERVEVLAIPSSNQQAIFQQRVSYLEQVTETLGISSDLSSYCSGPSPSMANADIKPEVHKLIHDLVLHIHENEPDIEKSILVFLPTYHALAQQWHLLKPLHSFFKVHILHRSIDTEQALMAMKIWKSHRKVILATNIAESSVTIPKVAYVIDSCRSLQVFWDSTRKKDSVKLVWVSKSQADQRKGRTGRTCDGQTYRLVTSSFFSKLEDYECPAILRLSLRSQVLLICCAESKAINDSKVLLQKALDPPDSEVVDDALSLLVQMRALEKTPRGRYEATFYGRLLASFSLSFDASVLVIKFGDYGMLREGILLGILMDIMPSPILHPFGEEHLFAEYTNCYFSGDCDKTVQIGRREALSMANLCAYQFWQRVFKDKHRVEHLKQLLKFDEVKATAPVMPKIEEEWCLLHNLVQSSLHHISEIYEDILSSVHRFRPKFLSVSNSLPTYYDPYEFEHTCLIKCQPNEDTGVAADDELNEKPCQTRICAAVPFVSSTHFQTKSISETLTNIVKEVRVQYTEEASHIQHINDGDISSIPNVEPPLCVYFLNGVCNRGSRCPFSHSLQAKRPVCKFFSSLQGCRNGESCSFSHDLGPSVSTFSSTSCLPEDSEVNVESLVGFLPTSSDGYILLLDDNDLHFSLNLARHYDQRKIISTPFLPEISMYHPSLTDIKIIWGLTSLYQAIIGKAGEMPIPWTDVKCVLWYPNLDSYSEKLDRQKSLVQNFFEYLAIRMLADALYEVQVIVTMNNIKFSQIQVEQLGRENFFFLGESFPFDEASFGEVPGTVATKKQLLVSRPTSYIFDLHPPTDIQFGNYGATLHKCLYEIHEDI